MIRIALPIEKGKLCDCFEQCHTLKIIDIKNHAIIKDGVIGAPIFEPKVLSGWLVKNGITDIIANRMKQEFIKICNLNKVNVFVGVQKEELNELVQEFIDGILVTNGELLEG